jgi:phosphatidate cytidylyltransferase
MVAITGPLFLLRPLFTIGFIAVILACFWEFYINFLKRTLDLPGMMISVFFILGGFFLYISGKKIFGHLAVIQSLILGIMLFLPVNCKAILTRCPWIIISFFFLPLATMMMLLSSSSGLWTSDDWRIRIINLLILVFATDIFAWLFGHLLGKHKLGSISPRKTWEGLIWGSITAYVLGVVFYFVTVRLDLRVLVVFAPFGFLAQLGDLVQSKFKRDFGLKDSSAIIPGHGGVYDRMDAVIFTLPFFFMAMQFLQR